MQELHTNVWNIAQLKELLAGRRFHKDEEEEMALRTEY
jgi:hypothetical protein